MAIAGSAKTAAPGAAGGIARGGGVEGETAEAESNAFAAPPLPSRSLCFLGVTLVL